MMLDCYLAGSWSDADLVPVRDWRRQNAMVIQDPDANKDQKREAKKYERAATLVLNIIEGVGPPVLKLPVEIKPHIDSALCRLGGSHT